MEYERHDKLRLSVRFLKWHFGEYFPVYSGNNRRDNLYITFTDSDAKRNELRRNGWLRVSEDGGFSLMHTGNIHSVNEFPVQNRTYFLQAQYFFGVYLH